MTDINTIADLKQDSRNARKHTPRNVGMIEKSLGEVGAARSIVIDELGNILAGNATVEAAANAGMERVQVVDADGETIIAVRRTGLTPEQKVKLALYDNRAAELADWDTAVLAGLNDEVDLSAIFYENELGAILEPAYAPNLNPQLGAGDYNDSDVNQARLKLENAFNKERALEPVKCPKCGEEFFVDK
jgi:hypothetical protein